MNIKTGFIRTFPRAYDLLANVIGVTPKGRAQGPDLSHWKDFYDPEKGTQRTDFAIMKLTEGTAYVDSRIDAIWSGVQKVPIRGGFHYQRSGMSWQAQADFFLKVAARYDFHMLILDVEPFNNTLNDSFFADAYRIINFWTEKQPSKRVMLYTNKDIFQNWMYPAIKRLYGASGVKWLCEDVPFWYAQYWNEWSVDKDPSMPAQRATWDLWQITARADPKEWGAGSLSLDLNVFNGTPEEMADWVRVTLPTPEPEPEPEPEPIPIPIPIDPTPEAEIWNATVISGNKMICRKYPVAIDATRTGYYVTGGEQFTGRLWVGNGYVWMLIDSSPRVELPGRWVAVRADNGSSKFITLTKTAVSDQPSAGLRHFVLRDWERSDFAGDITRPNLPMVFRMGQLDYVSATHFTDMTEEIQYFCLGIFSKVYYGRSWRKLSISEYDVLAQKTAALYSGARAFNNRHGMEMYRNYLTRKIDDMHKDMVDPAIETIITGGATIEGEVVLNRHAEKMVKVCHFDATKPMPAPDDIDPFTDPRVFMATTITGKKIGTGYSVNPFPQHVGGLSPNVPVPIIARFDIYYRLKDLRPVDGMGKPSPYWP